MGVSWHHADTTTRSQQLFDILVRRSLFLLILISAPFLSHRQGHHRTIVAAATRRSTVYFVVSLHGRDGRR